MRLRTRDDLRMDEPITSRTTPNGHKLTSSGLLAMNLPLLPRRLQLPVTLGMDLLLPPSKHVLRCDVARRAVQPTLL
ncbi:MAG TPA: hypothetical protein VEX68_00855 [Bryobacteraceae bacterium]|nr:hypothetical protein [Bryobacteraceae bacterium]